MRWVLRARPRRERGSRVPQPKRLLDRRGHRRVRRRRRTHRRGQICQTASAISPLEHTGIGNRHESSRRLVGGLNRVRLRCRPLESWHRHVKPEVSAACGAQQQYTQGHEHPSQCDEQDVVPRAGEWKLPHGRGSRSGRCVGPPSTSGRRHVRRRGHSSWCSACVRGMVDGCRRAGAARRRGRDRCRRAGWCGNWCGLRARRGCRRRRLLHHCGGRRDWRNGCGWIGVGMSLVGRCRPRQRERQKPNGAQGRSHESR